MPSNETIINHHIGHQPKCTIQCSPLPYPPPPGHTHHPFTRNHRQAHHTTHHHTSITHIHIPIYIHAHQHAFTHVHTMNQSDTKTKSPQKPTTSSSMKQILVELQPIMCMKSKANQVGLQHSTKCI